jgi:hypothetical protein
MVKILEFPGGMESEFRSWIWGNKLTFLSWDEYLVHGNFLLITGGNFSKKSKKVKLIQK